MRTIPFPPRESLRRDLVVSTIDALAFSVMVGCGETYFAAFALALGLGPVASGMVATVPVLVAAIVQLVAARGAVLLGSNRRWVIACTLVQAACFAPLIGWALSGRARLWELILAASAYWAAGMAAAPAWTAWMAALVPDHVRTPYFAHRNRLAQIGVFAGFVTSGLILQWGEPRDAVLISFAAMFAVAAAARLVSSACLWACSEPPGSAASPAGGGGPRARGVADVLRDMADRRSGPLVAFLSSFVFGTQMAAPYFASFMLRELGFSYHAFMLVIGTSFLAKALFLPVIGRLASRVGAVRLLGMASLAIVPLAALWLPSRNVAYLCLVQVAAGACWAAHELAVTLIFFKEVGVAERAGVVSVYNLGVAVATVAGAAAGGGVLRALGGGWHAYAAVFAISCLARLAAMPLLRRAGAAGA